MKAMWIAFAAIVVIALGANAVLGRLGFSTAEYSRGADVRLN